MLICTREEEEKGKEVETKGETEMSQQLNQAAEGSRSLKVESVPADGRLPWVTRIAYGSGDAACNVVYGMISTLLTIFYTDYVGVSLATVGLVMLISRIFDGTSDVIMGVVTEKTKSKWGKCRPWMMWMAVPYAVTAMCRTARFRRA